MIYTQSQPRAYWAWDSASQLTEAHTQNQLWLYVYVKIEKSRRSKDRKNQDTNDKAPLEMSHSWGSHVGDRHSTHYCAPVLYSSELCQLWDLSSYSILRKKKKLQEDANNLSGFVFFSHDSSLVLLLTEVWKRYLLLSASTVPLSFWERHLEEDCELQCPFPVLVRAPLTSNPRQILHVSACEDSRLLLSAESTKTILITIKREK